MEYYTAVAVNEPIRATSSLYDSLQGWKKRLNLTPYPSGLIRGSSGQMQPSRPGLASKTGPLC